MRALLKVTLLSLLFLGTAQADVVVIVNPLGPDSLAPSQVSQLYLGKSKNLADRGKAYIIEMAEGSDLRREFHAKVTHKNEPQLQAYWSRLVFTGKGTPPKTVRTPTRVLSLVSSTPNAIGYLDAALVDDSVKIAYKP
ncbi:MAG: ABC-type phosphate transport system substrate-binding protein [Moritella sp.]|jgi:ABC-type phosphate transport system substrate-binding protein